MKKKLLRGILVVMTCILFSCILGMNHHSAPEASAARTVSQVNKEIKAQKAKIKKWEKQLKKQQQIMKKNKKKHKKRLKGSKSIAFGVIHSRNPFIVEGVWELGELGYYCIKGADKNCVYMGQFYGTFKPTGKVKKWHGITCEVAVYLKDDAYDKAKEKASDLKKKISKAEDKIESLETEKYRIQHPIEDEDDYDYYDDHSEFDEYVDPDDTYYDEDSNYDETPDYGDYYSGDGDYYDFDSDYDED